jgi:kumamolisin
VASGDDGAHGCYRNQVPPDLQVSVDWPSASSHTISVGGTTLFHERSGEYVREEAWVLPNGIGGAGGGVSIVVPKPPWQVAPGVENASSTGFRQVPDVAGPSDPSSNLILVVWDPDSDDYIPVLGGGTSAAAPFWAGVTALLQQHVGGTVGDLSPILYGIANSRDYAVAFFDVSSGANDVYVASAGWDYITGLGSPRVDGLAELLSAP